MLYFPANLCFKLQKATSLHGFEMFTLNYEKEVEIFNQRNQDFIELFPLLQKAISNISQKMAGNNESEQMILMLGWVCFRHYEAIVLLCINGFGARAMAELRSFFEKCVDLGYLSKNPSEIETFIDYRFVQLNRMKFKRKAQKIDPNYKDRIDRFIKLNRKGVRWTILTVKEQAKSVGIHDWIIQFAYTIANEYVHSSCTELELHIGEKVNGAYSPLFSDNEEERKLTDDVFRVACLLLIEILDKLTEYFKLPKDTDLDEFFESFKKALKPKAE